MAKFCFTGNPFVDAGIAGMCAAAEVGRPEDLNIENIDRAVDALLRVMASDAAFRKRLIGKKETAFATSEMSVIFPNGPHSQASYRTNERKREEYGKRLAKKREAVRDLFAGQPGPAGIGSCFVDGSPAIMLVGNDEFPLVDSKNKRNFHPGLQAGHAIGAITALALEFFPLAVLRTGVNCGCFLFVHTADPGIAVDCCRLNLAWMNAVIARGDGLGFFGDWKLPSRDVNIAIVALIRNLMTGTRKELTREKIMASEYPVTAYVFSNDNRGAQIEAHDLPHELFNFFGRMHYLQRASEEFDKEILRSERIGWPVAKKMLLREPIVNLCCVRPDGDSDGRLLGGWEANILYATEVLGMCSSFVRDIEMVSERITASENAKGILLALQKDGAHAALLRLVRNELMTFDEYARLGPPEDSRSPFMTRDYLLAAVYARQTSLARAEEFTLWNAAGTESTHAKKDIVLFVEHVGGKLILDSDIAKRSAASLAQSRKLSELRGAVLRVVQWGVLNWDDFIRIFPPDDQRVSFMMRDYLLAFLYNALKDPGLPNPDEVIEKS